MGNKSTVYLTKEGLEELKNEYIVNDYIFSNRLFYCL